MPNLFAKLCVLMWHMFYWFNWFDMFAKNLCDRWKDFAKSIFSWCVNVGVPTRPGEISEERYNNILITSALKIPQTTTELAYWVDTFSTYCSMYWQSKLLYVYPEPINHNSTQCNFLQDRQVCFFVLWALTWN